MKTAIKILQNNLIIFSVEEQKYQVFKTNSNIMLDWYFLLKKILNDNPDAQQLLLREAMKTLTEGEETPSDPEE